MGDPRRFEAFARFLRTTFPAAATVADVAGGHGELAFWLAELGLRPVIIDPRPAALPRWVRRTLRKRARRTGRGGGIERVAARVEDADLRPYDLVAALHPDAATEPAVRAAVAQGVDFAVVPCCVFPLDGVTRSRAAWLTHLASLAPGACVSTLPMDGASTVLWRPAGRRPVRACAAGAGAGAGSGRTHEEGRGMSQRPQEQVREQVREHPEVSPGDPPGSDPWGIRVPTRPPDTRGRRGPPPPEEADRLVGLLLDEPAVAGRLRGVERSDIASGSGATLLYGRWAGPGGAAREAATNPDGSFPAIVKLGAGAREVHWATQLAQHAPDVVPGVYAAGLTLGGAPAPWLLMERCAVRFSDDWLRAPWKPRVFTTLLDAGVRFQLAARRIAPPVGPADVDVAWLSGLVRRALTCDPPAPGPRELAERVVARLAHDWAWVLSVCRVELCHGDLYPGNAVWRTAPREPGATALLVDLTPGALPWALEAAYCEAIYWGGGTGHPVHATTTHETAALRAAYGLDVPARTDVDRLAALCAGWQAMRLWPTRTRYHGRPQYEAAVARAIAGAART